MESDERLRLFCALLLPSEAVDALVAWQHRELGAADGLRIVPQENLHVTLAFLGSTGRSHLSGVAEALRCAAAEVDAPLFTAVRYRETKSVGMIVLADKGGRATSLAGRLWNELEGRRIYERERRKRLPHITVARFRSRPRLAPPVPDLRDVVSSDAAVMISRLRPGGAQYEVFETVSLGG